MHFDFLDSCKKLSAWKGYNVVTLLLKTIPPRVWRAGQVFTSLRTFFTFFKIWQKISLYRADRTPEKKTFENYRRSMTTIFPDPIVFLSPSNWLRSFSFCQKWHFASPANFPLFCLGDNFLQALANALVTADCFPECCALKQQSDTAPSPMRHPWPPMSWWHLSLCSPVKRTFHHLHQWTKAALLIHRH